MAQENRASFACIGLAVTLGVVAIVAALVYIGGLGAKDDSVFVETYYDKPVSGLSVGSAVNLRGVKIGEVKDIDFVGNRYDVSDDADHLIYIRIAATSDKLRMFAAEGLNSMETVNRLVANGLRATVTTSGITGLSRIECDFYPNDPKGFRPNWKTDCPFIPTHYSLLDNFSDAATKVMNQINTMDIGGVWSNINATVQHLARASDSASGLIESHREDYSQVMSNLKDITIAVREFSNEIRDNPSLLVRERVAQPLPETR